MSRRHPHFNKQRLSEALRARGIDYEHFVGLGGRPWPRPDSRNTAWNNEQFRGYADHMKTREFEEAIARVLARASEQCVALMCAELLWWECHRSLIADYLKVRGHEVTHIVSARKTEAIPTRRRHPSSRAGFRTTACCSRPW